MTLCPSPLAHIKIKFNRFYVKVYVILFTESAPPPDTGIRKLSRGPGVTAIVTDRNLHAAVSHFTHRRIGDPLLYVYGLQTLWRDTASTRYVKAESVKDV